MADRTEQIILQVEIDREDVTKDLDKIELSLLNAKKQQVELNKAFKEGKVTEEQYIKSNRELQKVIKTETDQKKVLNKLLDTESNSRNAMRLRVAQLNAEYNDLNQTTDKGRKRAEELQKELSQLNAELNKGSKAAGQFKDNIGNYPEQFSNAVDQVKPFGLSVSDAGASMQKFLNPAAAGIAILTGLASAYASSSRGAKDLAFSQDLLTSATEAISESIGSLIGGEGSGGEGEGLLSKLIGGFLYQLSPSLLTTAASASVAKEALRDLEIEAARAQGFAKLFENAAENARRLRDEEDLLLEDRLKAADAVEQNLLANQKVRLNVLNQEIEAIKNANANWQNQNAVVLQIEQKRAETRDIEEEINGKLTENLTARKKIRDEITALDRAERRARNPLDASVDDPLQGAFATELNNQYEMQLDFNDRLLKADEKFQRERRQQEQNSARARIELEQKVADARVDITIGFLDVAASLFDQQSEEYKALATFQTLISTYTAAQKAYEAAFLPIPTVASPGLGVAYAALAVAQGLARVAQINGVEFAEGGWTGPGTKYQPVGVVHADEYVVPKKINNSPAAQPYIAALESMRLRPYYDGGYTASAITQPINQNLDVMNLIKSMPAPVVGVKQIATELKAVQVKQNISKR